MEKLLTTGLTILGLIFLTSATPIFEDYEEQWNNDEARTLARSWDWRDPFGWRSSSQTDIKGTKTSNSGGVATIGEVNMMTGIFAGGKAVNTIAWCDDRTCTTIKCTRGACSGFTYATSTSSGSQTGGMPVIPHTNGMLYVPQNSNTNNIMQSNGQASGTVQGIESHVSGMQTSVQKNDETPGSSDGPNVAQDSAKPTLDQPTNTKEVVVPKDKLSAPIQENTSSYNAPSVVILKENL